MKRALITGVAGFIGSHLAAELLRQGWFVTGLDTRSPASDPVAAENLADLASDPHFQFVGADVAADDLTILSEGIQVVFHLAALAGVRRSWGDRFSDYLTCNVLGTQRLLEACAAADMPRLVFASSSSVYGAGTGKLSRETDPPLPLSPYAVQKLTCEYYIQSFYRAYGLEGICLRYFNIFGPRQAADSPYSGVIAQFTYKMMAGETPTIFGDGLTSRDFNYVDNAVSANLLACVAPSAVATGRVFNIGTGKSHTLNEVYEAIAGQLGFTGKPIYAAPRAGDIKHSLANIDRAANELGYQPKFHFHDGLRKTVEWYLAEREKMPVGALQG